MAENWIIKLIQSALIPTLLSIIASVIVAWFTSERWVEIYRRKREHSIRLKDSSIKYWISKIDEMCPLNTEFDHAFERVFRKDIQSYEFLPYDDFIESHMKSGYPHIHKRWEEYQSLVEHYADDRARILDDIRIEFEKLSESIDATSYYHRMGTSRPDVYIQPYEIAKALLHEKENRMKSFEDWHAGGLSTQNTSVDGVILPGLSYHTFNLMRANIDDVEKIRIRMLEILADSDYHHKIAGLVTKKDTIVISHRWMFIENLKQIVEFIELGHNIEGNCDACRGHILPKIIRKWISARELKRA